MRHETKCPKLFAQRLACFPHFPLSCWLCPLGSRCQQAALALPSTPQPPLRASTLRQGGPSRALSLLFLLSIPQGPDRWDESCHAERMQKKEKLISSGMKLFIPTTNKLTDTHSVLRPPHSQAPLGRPGAKDPLHLPLPSQASSSSPTRLRNVHH